VLQDPNQGRTVHCITTSPLAVPVWFSSVTVSQTFLGFGGLNGFMEYWSSFFFFFFWTLLQFGYDLCFFFFFFYVSRYSQGWSWIQDSPTSATWMLGAQVCNTVPSFVYFVVRLGLWVWRGMTTQVRCHSYHIMSRWYQMTYLHWCWPWPPGCDRESGFFPVKLLSFHAEFFREKKKSLHGLHLRSRKLNSTSLRVKYLHKLFVLSLHLPHLPYPFTWQYGLMDICLYFGL
jgi:hypothetical protein